MNNRKPMWDLRQLTDDTLALYIYGDVESDGYDFWTGDAVESETSANHFRAELEKHPNVENIDVYINSYGGSVFEGTAIYNQLRRHPAKKTVYIDGFACSIASVIAMAGDRVIMPKNALMMVHNMWMGAVGNTAQLRKAADDLEIINKAGRTAYLEKAGDKLTEKKLAELMDAETWLSAEDCVSLGLADEIGEKDADMSQSAEMLKKANLDMAARVTMQKSLAAQLRDLTAAPGQVEPTAPPQNNAKSKFKFLF